VSLENKTLRLRDVEWPFEIDDYTAARLLAGLDDIGATLQHEAEIAAYEAGRPTFLPHTIKA